MAATERPTTKLYGDNEYHTPPGDRRSLTGRILPGRMPFFLYLARLVRRGGIQARRGEFTEQVFVDRSEDLVSYIEACGGRIHVEGLAAVKGDPSPVVIVSNHMSLLETFMFPAMLLPTKPAVFIVKQALMTYPYLGNILRVREAIAVGRKNPREDLRTVLKDGVASLDSGNSVCVFPQSTRSLQFDPSKFNSIGVKLAERAGVPVIPVAVKTDFLGKGRFLKDFGPVHPEKELHFRFGEPIPVERGNAKTVQAGIVEFIRTHLSGWGVPCLE